ncbi:hypothetical protein BASA60_005547 [Batrachochytrium salamandrivorans]|nr:hypothetical protein BASA60_005547 [Batrachochytrium salamandrivorans]
MTKSSQQRPTPAVVNDGGRSDPFAHSPASTEATLSTTNANANPDPDYRESMSFVKAAARAALMCNVEEGVIAKPTKPTGSNKPAKPAKSTKSTAATLSTTNANANPDPDYRESMSFVKAAARAALMCNVEEGVIAKPTKPTGPTGSTMVTTVSTKSLTKECSRLSVTDSPADAPRLLLSQYIAAPFRRPSGQASTKKSSSAHKRAQKGACFRSSQASSQCIPLIGTPTANTQTSMSEESSTSVTPTDTSPHQTGTKAYKPKILPGTQVDLKHTAMTISGLHSSKADPVRLIWSALTMPDKMRKYWRKRYLLFSKFDYGVLLDIGSLLRLKTLPCISLSDRGALSWWTPFVGSAGNAIQFALTCDRVIAIDIDPVRLECARHNAAIYGVQDKIEFIRGDFMELMPTLKADGVFMSPPWGGPSYSDLETFDIDTMMPMNGTNLFNQVRDTITPNIIYFLPRNVNHEQVRNLAAPGETCEMEETLLNGRVTSYTVYFGDFVHDGDEES